MQAKERNVQVRMPVELYDRIKKEADKKNTSVAATIRYLSRLGFEVEDRLTEYAAYADTVREHLEVWHDLPEVDKVRIKAELDAYATVRMLAENAQNREDKDLDE
ncbi:MAG: hypothetical protein PHN90_10950 [Methanothrix sp.]|jgi:hypothetical protein|nr:hypothetical protein [Methanothrix sp.]